MRPRRCRCQRRTRVMLVGAIYAFRGKRVIYALLRFDEIHRRMEESNTNEKLPGRHYFCAKHFRFSPAAVRINAFMRMGPRRVGLRDIATRPSRRSPISRAIPGDGDVRRHFKASAPPTMITLALIMRASLKRRDDYDCDSTRRCYHLQALQRHLCEHYLSIAATISRKAPPQQPEK